MIYTHKLYKSSCRKNVYNDYQPKGLYYYYIYYISISISYSISYSYSISISYCLKGGLKGGFNTIFMVFEIVQISIF